MSTEAKFLDGLIFKMPHQNAPDFVKGKLSIKREELIKSLQDMSEEWVNLDLKVSKEGKAYAQIDTWKPQEESQGLPQENSDLPF